MDVVVGTLGKALGGYGAYVCGSRELVEYLSTPRARSSSRPRRRRPSSARPLAALELLEASPSRVEQLRANAATLREAWRPRGSRSAARETQIVPVVVGDADATMALCERLLERGVFAQAIRPPTVPEGPRACA